MKPHPALAVGNFAARAPINQAVIAALDGRERDQIDVDAVPAGVAPCANLRAAVDHCAQILHP